MFILKGSCCHFFNFIFHSNLTGKGIRTQIVGHEVNFCRGHLGLSVLLHFYLFFFPPLLLPCLPPVSSSETFIDLLVSVFALERLLSKSEHVPMVGRPSESALPAADESYSRSENERTVGKNERLCKDTCNTYASSFSTISFLYSFFLSLPSFVLSQFSFDSLLLIIKSKWLSPFYGCFSFFL